MNSMHALPVVCYGCRVSGSAHSNIPHLPPEEIPHNNYMPVSINYNQVLYFTLVIVDHCMK